MPVINFFCAFPNTNKFIVCIPFRFNIHCSRKEIGKTCAAHWVIKKSDNISLVSVALAILIINQSIFFIYPIVNITAGQFCRRIVIWSILGSMYWFVLLFFKNWIIISLGGSCKCCSYPDNNQTRQYQRKNSCFFCFHNSSYPFFDSIFTKAVTKWQ